MMDRNEQGADSNGGSREMHLHPMLRTLTDGRLMRALARLEKNWR
jgi:hypothetical protein